MASPITLSEATRAAEDAAYMSMIVESENYSEVTPDGKSKRTISGMNTDIDSAIENLNVIIDSYGELNAIKEEAETAAETATTKADEASASAQAAEDAMADVITSLVGIGGYSDLVGSGTTIDASVNNTATVITTDALEINSVPEGAYTLTLLITPDSVDFTNLSIKWVGGIEPVFTTDEDLLFLTTLNQGVTWYGSASVGYV